MSETGTAARARAGWDGAGYVLAVLGTEVLVAVLGLLPLEGSPGGNVVQLMAYPLGLLAAVVLWVRYPMRRSARGLLRVFLALAVVLWVVETGRTLLGGDAFTPVYVTTGLLLVMIWLKPPGVDGARRIVDGMAVVFMTAVLVAVILEVVGVAPSWYRLYPLFVEIIGSDNQAYWLPLADVLGLDGRWAGPFPHPNMAGPVGGFLIVVGLCRTGWLQWSALATGLLVLVLTGSRTSTIAALAAALVVLLAAGLRSWPRSWWSRAALLGTPLAIGGILLGTAVFTTPDGTVPSAAETVERFGTFTGRTSIWPIYVRIWLESRWTGVPDARIDGAIATGELPGWAITAHNLPLDALTRFGVLGALLVAAALGVALVMALRAANVGRAVGLGTVSVILTCGLTETLLFWRALAASTILLLVSVLASIRDPETATGASPLSEESGPAPIG